VLSLPLEILTTYPQITILTMRTREGAKSQLRLPKGWSHALEETKTEEENFKEYANIGVERASDSSSVIPANPLPKPSKANASLYANQGRNWSYETNYKNTLAEDYEELAKAGKEGTRTTRSGLIIEQSCIPKTPNAEHLETSSGTLPSKTALENKGSATNKGMTIKELNNAFDHKEDLQMPRTVPRRRANTVTPRSSRPLGLNSNARITKRSLTSSTTNAPKLETSGTQRQSLHTDRRFININHHMVARSRSTSEADDNSSSWDMKTKKPRQGFPTAILTIPKSTIDPSGFEGNITGSISTSEEEHERLGLEPEADDNSLELISLSRRPKPKTLSHSTFLHSKPSHLLVEEYHQKEGDLIDNGRRATGHITVSMIAADTGSHIPNTSYDYDSTSNVAYEVQTGGPVVARERMPMVVVQHQNWCNKFANRDVKLCIIDGNNGNVYTNLHRSRDLPIAFFVQNNTGEEDLNFYSSVKMLDTIAKQDRTSLTSVNFEFYHALWYDTDRHGNEYEGWLKQLGELHDLTEVRQVEFKRAEWGEYIGDEHMQEKTKDFLFKLLAYFPGMKELTMSDYDPITVKKIASDELLSDYDMTIKSASISNRGLNDEEAYRQCQKELTELLVKNKGIFAGGVVPRLEVVNNYTALRGLNQLKEAGHAPSFSRYQQDSQQ